MKALLIRYSSIGDILLTTPVVRALHSQLNWEIHYLTKEKFGSVLSDNPYIEKVIYYEHSSIKELRDEQYDLYIDLHNSLRSTILKARLGVKGLTISKRSFKKQKKLLLRPMNQNKMKHIVLHYFEELSQFNIKYDGQGLNFYPAAPFPFGNSLDSKRPLIVVGTGGSVETKRVQPFMLEHICDKDEYNIYLLGGSDVDSSKFDGLAAKNLIGKTSLKESASIIDKAQLVISGDSSIMHLAAALNKKMLVVWGSTSDHLGIYPIYSENGMEFTSIQNERISCRPCSKYGRVNCPMGHMSCLNGLSSRDMLRKVEMLLSEEKSI